MTIQEYKKIAQVGDVIETNGNGASIVDGMSHPFLAKVTKINNALFLVQWLDPVHRQEGKRCGFPDEKMDGDYAIRWDNPVATVALINANGSVPAPQKPKVLREMSIVVERAQGNIEISIKVPDEVEAYYKNLSADKKKKSSVWFYADNKAASFYVLTPELNEAEQRIDSDVFSDYGDTLIKNGRINTAILRTEGSSKRITIKSGHFNVATNVDIEYYCKRLGVFLKNLWEKSISPQKIKTTITYELQ